MDLEDLVDHEAPRDLEDQFRLWGLGYLVNPTILVHPVHLEDPLDQQDRQDLVRPKDPARLARPFRPEVLSGLERHLYHQNNRHP